LGWPGGIGLGLGSVLLLKVLGSILSGVNWGGLIYLLQKKIKKFSGSTFYPVCLFLRTMGIFLIFPYD